MPNSGMPRETQASDVVGLVPGIRLGAKARRVDIRTRTRQHHAIHRIQQGADIGDVRCTGKHQRKRARDFGHRAEIPLPDHLRRKSIFDAIGISDHTDHRPPHRSKSNLASQMPASIMPG
jgi:hypothetical protein